ncbi:MAG: hypothetical protein ACLGHL_03030 [Actinomycetota bacterium]
MVAIGSLLFAVGIGLLVVSLSQMRAQMEGRVKPLVVGLEEDEGAQPDQPVSLVYRAVEPLLAAGGSLM